MVQADAAGATDRRRRAAEAGHAGDEAVARRLLGDESPEVRATAVGALARMRRLAPPDLEQALADPHPLVRRRAAAEARHQPGVGLVQMLADADASVVEAATWAIGERGATAAWEVDALAKVASTHEDPLCREAAVAALGAIGDPRGLPAIMRATGDRPAVRRRAVLALAPFEGPDVDAALKRALDDRDWQVRQAAEDLLAGE